MHLKLSSIPKINSNNVDALCQNYLAVIYQDFRNQHSHLKDIKNSIAETYGQILYPSLNKILSHLKLTEQDIFVDLGSGCGQALIQVFLQSRVKEAYGIEISSKLHQQALTVADRVGKELPGFFAGERKLHFVQGDFLQTSIPTATVALLVSTCFGQDLLYPLGEKLNNMREIHTVISLRPLCNLERLSLKKITPVEGSWDSALCYIYNDGAF